MDNNQTGSILLRRGPTEDRNTFTPLSGEIIYDSTTQQIFVGDAETGGGKPAFGDKITVDDDGNITAVYLFDRGDRPQPDPGLLRYNASNNTLEYGDGSSWNLIASSPFDNKTNILYVSPSGRDDFTFGNKRGRSQGTAFKSLNAACREAERIVRNATKGLGPYVKTITFNQGAGTSLIDSIIDDSPYKKLQITNGNTNLDSEKEIRSGFRIIGQISGAKAIIEEYNPSESTTDEIIVEVEEGTFVEGESLKFGAAIPSSPFIDNNKSIPEVTIFVATGIYYEDFPIKVPVNTSIKGDEFRRSIIRPRPGMSRSPYSNIAFKRDDDKIGLTGTGRTFGRHYLTDRNMPIVDLMTNEGGYADEAEIIAQNRVSIIDSVISFIDTNFYNLTYNKTLCRRDTGYILDALITDLTFGGSRETLNTGLSYYDKEPALPQNQTMATAQSVEHIATLISNLIDTPIVNTIITNYVNKIADIIRDNFNRPKNNEELDVLLMNDATIIRNITVQRHGGFMEVLDPEGQIKTRSPYTQTASSFSRSKAPQVSFAGGMFVDGFCGNLDGEIVASNSQRELVLENFEREPQWPTSFYINGSRFQIDKIDTVGVADNQFRAVLSSDTPWTDSHYQIVNEGDSLPGFPVSIEILTAGNLSLLSNDYTQINDLGYGLYVTNAARAEAVSVFTYYCHKGYLSEKGGEIRSLNGSSAYGNFALVASGSDPLEVPDVVNLTEPQIQTAEVITDQDRPNNEGDIQVFVTNFDYTPFNTSEIEIDHTGTLDSDGEEVEFVRYFVTGVSQTGTTDVVQLNLSSGESSEAAGLATDLPNGTPVTIRQSQSLQFGNVRNVQPTRPSTALVFQDDTDTIYRVLDYDIANLPPETANLGIAQSYDYVKFNVADSAGSVAGSGQSGDSKIRLETDLDEKETQRILGAIQSGSFYEFGFNGLIHEVIGYRNQSQTGQDYAEIDIQPPINKSLAEYSNKPTFRGGRKAGAAAEITVKISTLRTTSHDLLDIGTGSFQDSNYPRRIFGEPENPARQENEVIEENKGRVFYATSDQDGNFRVGEFFKVDQGTGTVTFAASVALSNLDGIGFKRGVAISEFSTDDGMLDNASDAVPVESAVRQYVNRRLGLNHNNTPVSNLIGPGFVDRTGDLPMLGQLNLDDNKIVNLENPSDEQDATTKSYVDSRSFSVNQISATLDENISINTSAIPEGSNLYFTESRVRSSISANEPITYDSSIGEISWNGTTSNVPEGSNLYFTESRARNSLSALDTGGDGEFSYDSGLGRFTYRGPSAAETRAHFSGSGLVEYNENTGVINVDPITVNGQSGDVELFTDNVPEDEDPQNRYFTEERVRGSIGAVDNGGDGSFTYDSATGVFSYTGPSPAEARAHFSASGDLSYNQSTGNFSVTTYKDSDARQAISVSDQGGDGSLSYNNSSGVITYQGPTAAEVRAHFSGGTGVLFNSSTGEISIGQPIGVDADVNFNNLTIDGNLTVNGNQTIFGTNTTEFYDVNLVLNADKTGSPGNELISLEIERGTANNVALRWNDSIDEWEITKDGSTYDTIATAGDVNTATSSGFVNSTSFNTSNGVLTLSRTDGTTLTQDLDGRWYTQTSLDSGQLDNRYYTESELDNGQLDNRYYTESESDSRFVNESGDTMTGGLAIDRGVTQGKITIDPAHGADNDPVFRIHQDNGGYSGFLLDMDNDDVERSGGNNGFAIRVRTQDGGFDSYTDSNTIFNLSSQGHLYINYGATISGLSGDPHLAVNGSSYLNGKLLVNSNIEPVSANTNNLGANGTRWDTVYANVFNGTATSAKYADLAEIYTSDTNYDIGTVVMFGGSKEITISKGFANTAVAGVISDKPAYLMNKDQKGQAVALKGRVFCKVLGTAKAGDLLVSSSIDGVAVANSFIGGAVIGKIIQHKNTETIDIVEILVG
jgi:hypothetical protein